MFILYYCMFFLLHYFIKRRGNAQLCDFSCHFITFSYHKLSILIPYNSYIVCFFSFLYVLFFLENVQIKTQNNTIKQVIYCLWFIVLFYFSNKFAFNLIFFILFYLLIFILFLGYK